MLVVFLTLSCSPGKAEKKIIIHTDKAGAEERIHIPYPLVWVKWTTITSGNDGLGPSDYQFSALLMFENAVELEPLENEIQHPLIRKDLAMAFFNQEELEQFCLPVPGDADMFSLKGRECNVSEFKAMPWNLYGCQITPYLLYLSYFTN